MQLYGLKSCDSCRKALKAFEAAGKTIEFVDIRESGIPRPVLEVAIETFGDAIVNRRSTTWRGLDPELQARAPRDIIAEAPTVMKRPFIVDGATMTLGWDAKAQAVWL